MVIPLLNGFPHTGALARTATNIKVGAQSPLAGIFKCFIKLSLAAFLASYLEIIPLASIGGIMLYVAVNIVETWGSILGVCGRQTRDSVFRDIRR